MRDDEEVVLEEVRYTAEDLFPDYIEKETPIDDDLKNKVQPQSANPFLNVKPPAVKVEEKPQKKSKKKENIQVKAITYLKTLKYFNYKNSVYYAKVVESGIEKYLDISSGDFEAFILESYMSDPAGPISMMNLKSILIVIKSYAKNNSSPIQSITRFGVINGELVWNLGFQNRNCVIINTDSVRIGSPGDVLLVCNEKTKPIEKIEFSSSGISSCEMFLDLFGITSGVERHWILMTLVSYLFAEVSTPILYLHGPAGSGKTTLASALKAVFDPNVGEFLHNNALELALTLDRSGIVFFDNFSSLSNSISDQFCLSYSSGSYTKKRNYSDTETIEISMKCPLILTSVTIPRLNQDFKARCAFIKIEPKQVLKSELEIKSELELLLPYVRGELCNLACTILKNYQKFQPLGIKRHADFDLIGQAYFEAIGFSSNIYRQFLEALKTSESTEMVKRSDPLNDLLLLMETHQVCAFTMSELYNYLLATSDDTSNYPINSANFAKLIKNNAPLLYNAGLLILCGTKKLNGHQYIAVNLASVVDRTSLILNYDLERLKIDPTYVSEVFPKIKAAQTLSLGIPTDLF